MQGTDLRPALGLAVGLETDKKEHASQLAIY